MPPTEKPRKQCAKPLTPHQKLMRAARMGKGVRLSAEEVKKLACDHAIIAVAENDDEEQGRGRKSHYF